jgi:aminoglycoside phosphotransferase (APT) family kinase protein
MSAPKDTSLGAEIVQASREARFAGVAPEEWGARLTDFIAAQPDVTGPVAVRDVRPVASAAGGSNGTLLFNASYATRAGDVHRDLVLRFAPENGLFPVYDVAAQFRIQKALWENGLPAPEQLWLDPDGARLGAPGYVMARVAGESPPMAWRAAGVIADAPPTERGAMMRNIVEALARVHAFDWRSHGLGFLETRGEGAREIERECNWYWSAAQWGGLSRELELLAPVRDWLVAKEPPSPAVLCHGDSNLGNYMLDGSKVSAVVDWEMAFIGAPECDLSLMIDGPQILQRDVPLLEGALSDEEIRAHYEAVSGRSLEHWGYYRAFSAYRVAIISGLAGRHFAGALADKFAILHEANLGQALDVWRQAS